MRLFLFLAILPFMFQQKPDPVHLRYTLKQVGPTTFEIHCKAKIDSGWHIYARVQPKSAVCQPTKISFDISPLAKLKGAPKEIGKLQQQILKEVDITQNFYEDSVELVQTVIVKTTARFAMHGIITYQACTGEMCLPPKDSPFTIEF
jgi:thiol:disulfide interchange protein DsbD